VPSLEYIKRHMLIPDPPEPKPAPEMPKILRVRIKDSNCELFAIEGPAGFATFTASGALTGRYRKEDVEILRR
jgi:hypothetical protein